MRVVVYIGGGGDVVTRNERRTAVNVVVVINALLVKSSPGYPRTQPLSIKSEVFNAFLAGATPRSLEDLAFSS
jgi:hypothetical protein